MAESSLCATSAAQDANGQLKAQARAEAEDMDAPKFIVKRAVSRGYEFASRQPTLERRWAWYVPNPVKVDVTELEREMQAPGRRWFASDKVAYQMMLRLQCPTDDTNADLEHWISIPSIENKLEKMYWIGRRIVREQGPRAALVTITVGEMYLKSISHQGRMYAALIHHLRRITGAKVVVQVGNTIEIRDVRPSDEALRRVSILPGVAKVYLPREDGDGEKFGTLLHDGVGGMPVLHDQPGLCLLSGGIDSPVAAHMMMCRGVHVNAVHFLNSTADAAAVISKNQRIAHILSKIQGTFKLHFVDIGKLQSQIVALVPNLNRTLVYKFFMLNIAAVLDDARILITGDSLGQVASQTIGNISTLYSNTPKAICAPLIGAAKREIVSHARRIGTMEESVLPASDCCQYMMCKQGANLFLGQRTLRALVDRIELPPLRMTTEEYVDGTLVRRLQSFVPTPAPRRAPRTMVAIRRGGRGRHRSSDTVDEEGCDTEDEKNGASNDAEEEEEEGEGGEARCINFDMAAGTPPAPAVLRAVVRAPHGNPSSLHHSGRAARMAIETVRADLAALMGVPARCIIFTSGGTESNNLALRGCRVVRDRWSHSSTIGDSAAAASELPTVRVIDLVNHETGTVNRELRRGGADRLHVDACQALCKLDFTSLDLREVDSIAVTAHKINGPQGVGALFVRDLALQPLFFGGAQEQGLRPGTENVAGIVGFGAAIRLDRGASQFREVESLLCAELRAMGLPVNRPPAAETSGFIVHTTLPEGLLNHEVIARLSAVHRVECGTGSACKSSEENVGVYEHLQIAPIPRKRSLRFSWDFSARAKDALHAAAALRECISALSRASSPSSATSPPLPLPPAAKPQQH